jgi:uncharacterized protein (TIGR02001 family)
MNNVLLSAVALLGMVAVPAAAQDTAPPAPVTVSGNVALVSDYRFRGVSQTNEDFAIQGGLTVAHESGFYIGTWASNLAGWGTFGGSNMELDLIGGFKKDFSGTAIDLGVTTYVYPGGAKRTTVVEPYVKVSGTFGPASLLAGVAYAPKQVSLGNWSNTPESRKGDKEDNLYLWLDASAGVPNTGLTAKAHIGYSDGNKGLGPNGTSLAPTGKYADWMVGADYAVAGTPLTLGVAYVDTDIGARESAYLDNLIVQKPGSKFGDQIADSQVVFSITAAF